MKTTQNKTNEITNEQNTNYKMNVLQYKRKKCVNHKWSRGYQSRLSGLCITFGTVHPALKCLMLN